MAAFCKKAMAQGSAIVVRFMGRYPPTARSVYKPPNSSAPDQQHNHAHAMQIRSELRRFSSIDRLISIHHSGGAAFSSDCHWLDCDPVHDDELEALVEEIERVIGDKLSVEQAAAIKDMVAKGKFSMVVYIVLLIELLALEIF